VVVGETAEIGDGCTIYQGVTLGGTSLYKARKRHPTLGRDVVVGAGAKVLGGFTVGDGARIGSNAVVTPPVPAGATAVGTPARIIPAAAAAAAGEAAAAPAAPPREAFSAYGITAGDDPLAKTMRSLIDSAASQEEQIALLWQAVAALTAQDQRCSGEALPDAAARAKAFEAEQRSAALGDR